MSPLLSAPAIRAAPAARTRRYLPSPEHYYVGRRTRETAVYVVSASAVDLLEHHGYRSSAAFDWGASTPGALELAFALLVHSTESRPPDPICTTFRTEVVARLDRPGFVLGYGEIALWLLTAFTGAGEPPTAGEPPNGGGWRARSLDRLRSWVRRR